MLSPHSLRSRFALLIVLPVTVLSWLPGTLIGQDASQRIREEVGRALWPLDHADLGEALELADQAL